MPGYSYSGFPEYLPLKVGNSWTYSWIEISSGGKFKVTVTKDSVINSKKYYQCNFPGLSQWFRIDSLSGNIYNYSKLITFNLPLSIFQFMLNAHHTIIFYLTVQYLIKYHLLQLNQIISILNFK